MVAQKIQCLEVNFQFQYRMGYLKFRYFLSNTYLECLLIGSCSFSQGFRIWFSRLPTLFSKMCDWSGFTFEQVRWWYRIFVSTSRYHLTNICWIRPCHGIGCQYCWRFQGDPGGDRTWQTNMGTRPEPSFILRLQPPGQSIFTRCHL